MLDGTDAVMLSAETAAGKYPLETVIEMASICASAEIAEDVSLDADFTGMRFDRTNQSLALGPLFTSHPPGLKPNLAAARPRFRAGVFSWRASAVSTEAR